MMTWGGRAHDALWSNRPFLRCSGGWLCVAQLHDWPLCPLLPARMSRQCKVLLLLLLQRRLLLLLLLLPPLLVRLFTDAYRRCSGGRSLAVRTPAPSPCNLSTACCITHQCCEDDNRQHAASCLCWGPCGRLGRVAAWHDCVPGERHDAQDKQHHDIALGEG